MPNIRKAEMEKIEAARRKELLFGKYRGMTLGEVMDHGKSGTEVLRWIANRYRGSDKELKESAQILLGIGEEEASIE